VHKQLSKGNEAQLHSIGIYGPSKSFRRDASKTLVTALIFPVVIRLTN
jgi:hypothetical protein